MVFWLSYGLHSPAFISLRCWGCQTAIISHYTISSIPCCWRCWCFTYIGGFLYAQWSVNNWKIKEKLGKTYDLVRFYEFYQIINNKFASQIIFWNWNLYLWMGNNSCDNLRSRRFICSSFSALLLCIYSTLWEQLLINIISMTKIQIQRMRTSWMVMLIIFFPIIAWWLGKIAYCSSCCSVVSASIPIPFSILIEW